MSSNAGAGPGVLRLIGDDHRWRLMRELGQSDLRVAELVERLGSTQNLVSYHLGQLRRSGLVTSRRSSADGRDAYYRFDIRRCAELLAATGSALAPALQLEPRRAGPGPSGRRRPLVLFLCTGNSARSQMGEALLEHLSAGTVRARSAGSHPKALHPHAVQVMAERGIDISANKTKHLDRFVRTRFDRVITLCDKVREICPEFPDGPVPSHWSMPDPSAGAPDEDSYPAFVRTADELEDRIGLLLAELSMPTTKEVHSEV
jgi:ArsR family transcriptional regulator, arsenate/arsenite/antimonite-responsive transcriptional repressor / arsenate reductase (thioredoxin)